MPPCLPLRTCWRCLVGMSILGQNQVLADSLCANASRSKRNFFLGTGGGCWCLHRRFGLVVAFLGRRGRPTRWGAARPRTRHASLGAARLEELHVVQHDLQLAALLSVLVSPLVQLQVALDEDLA